jgi:prevent-host-death family protein
VQLEPTSGHYGLEPLCLTRDTAWGVDEVTIRDLRNRGGEVMERIERGETLTVTRAGVPVGELRPLPRPRVTASALLARWRSVPGVELGAFRADVDAVLDSSL